jgi:hypothetical protein
MRGRNLPSKNKSKSVSAEPDAAEHNLDHANRAADATCSCGATGLRPYLSITQLAEVTPWSSAAIRTMMARGVFKLGVHFFKPFGPHSHPVFCWHAVEKLIREGISAPQAGETIRLVSGTVVDLDEATTKISQLLD